MAIDVDQYNSLKKRSDKARSDADKAAGSLEEQMKKLKTDFDVDTIEAGEKLLSTLQDEEKKLEGDYNRELKAFEEKWKEKI